MWGAGILKGMVITMRNMLRGPITVNYPEERLELPERARWAVTPVMDEEGRPLCTACGTCVRECPDDILSLEVTTAEDRTKHIVALGYEMSACMMCGLCVEACPYSAIRMGHDYELATPDVTSTYRVLIADTPAARPIRTERPTRAGGEAPATQPEPPVDAEPAGRRRPEEAADG